MWLQAKYVYFIGNIAKDLGGAFFGSEVIFYGKRISFINNTAGFAGGAVYAEKVRRLIFRNITVTGNTRSALSIRDSYAAVSGYSVLENNDGEWGGAIYAANAFIELLDITIFRNNRASVMGGAICSLNRAKILLRVNSVFENNTALRNGGAIYAGDTNITFNNSLNFNLNSAQNGGAIFFESGTKLTLNAGTIFNTSHNHASAYGGAMYHEDSSISTLQCEHDVGTDVRKMPNLLHGHRRGMRGIPLDSF